MPGLPRLGLSWLGDTSGPMASHSAPPASHPGELKQPGSYYPKHHHGSRAHLEMHPGSTQS